MNPDRRQVLTLLGATALSGLAGRSIAADSINLGDIRITTVSDGNLVLPGDFVFANLPEEELATILAQHNISRDEVHPPCNVTLMQDGPRTILFDAGSGQGFMPSAGALVDTLEALNVAPDDITHVVFTHAHPDHLWGILDDFDDPVFSNASYLINQTEWDYWRDPDTVNTIGDGRTAFAVGAARRLGAIEDTCEFFKDGQEILPGIMAHATFGHTPGHTSFEVRQGNNAVMVVGDAIANAHVAFARPDWASGSDQNADMGAATRQRLLDQLATDQIPMVGFHLPEGGLGRVVRKDSTYRFITEV